VYVRICAYRTANLEQKTCVRTPSFWQFSSFIRKRFWGIIIHAYPTHPPTKFEYERLFRIRLNNSRVVLFVRGRYPMCFIRCSEYCISLSTDYIRVKIKNRAQSSGGTDTRVPCDSETRNITRRTHASRSTDSASRPHPLPRAAVARRVSGDTFRLFFGTA